MRSLITEDPHVDRSHYRHEASPWPAMWISHPEWNHQTAIIAFRREFELEKAATVRIHVSADQRYLLFLDGRQLGRGPERSDAGHWMYETYDLDLNPGKHTLIARTWWLHENEPTAYAQVSFRHGFLLMAEADHGPLLNTGVAEWECRQLPGYRFVPPQVANGFQVTGAKMHLRGSEADWEAEAGRGGGWTLAVPVGKAAVASLKWEARPWWVLRPAMLPAMIEETRHVGRARHMEEVPTDDTRDIAIDAARHLATEAADWDRLLAGEGTVTVPPNTRRRIIVDLEDYYCAFPNLTTAGGAGAVIRVHWAEALYEQPEGRSKGNRDEIDGKYFLGIGDQFDPDGGEGRTFEPHWWEAGHYIELLVATGDEPLTIDAFHIRETHYPHEFAAEFEASDPRLAEVIPIALRTLEMCSHETYMDCPYYEQLMYVGDTRLEVLTTYATSHDDHLPRKAITLFDWSRGDDGLTMARYPTRITQVIPPFSLWWVGMVHDYAMWRDDPAFIAERMNGVRAVLNAFHAQINDEGLLESPVGWIFQDWVPGWGGGTPPDAHDGINGSVNFHTALILRLGAELEEIAGEPELATRNRAAADRIASAANRTFWDEGRGLYAEDRAREHFSEHAQCLALLGNSVPDEHRARVVDHLFNESDLARTTIYFSHYLFETCRLTGRMQPLFERLRTWFDLEPMGFKTTFEMPEPTRSDCHAWGAHPVFHYFATLLGIRPASPGFATVRIEPQLGPLDFARGMMAHPRGSITARFERDGEKLRGEIELPREVSGELILNGTRLPLHAGRQRV